MPNRSKKMTCFCGRTVCEGESCPCEAPKERVVSRPLYGWWDGYDDEYENNPLYWEAAAFHDDCGDR